MKRYYSILCVLGLFSFLPVSIVAQTLTINPNPVCVGSSVTFTVNGSGACTEGDLTYEFQRFAGMNWDTEATQDNNPVYQISGVDLFDQGMWRVVITDSGMPAEECITNTITLGLSEPHVVTITQPNQNMVTLCEGTILPLVANPTGGASNVTWSDGGAGGSFTNANNTATNYTPPSNFTGQITITVTTVSNGACMVAQDQVTLTYNQEPTAVISTPSSTICSNSSIQLMGTFSDASTITWNSNNGGTFTPSNGTTTNYTPPNNFTGDVMITLETNDPSGPCTAATSNTITITVVAPPAVNPSVDNDTKCQGQNFLLSAGQNNAVNGVLWTVSDDNAGAFNNNTSFAPTFISNGSYTGTFTVTVTTSNSSGNCTEAQADIPLTLVAEPSLSITSPASGSNVCQGSVVSLSTSSSGDVNGATWDVAPPQAGTISNSTLNPTFTVADDFTGLVTISATTTGSGTCTSDTDNISLNVKAAPSANLDLNSSNIQCETNASFSLVASISGQNFVEWSDGGAGGTFSPEGSLATTYTLSGPGSANITFVTESDGCGVVPPESVSITVVSEAIPSVQTDINEKCMGDVFDISAEISGNPSINNGTWSDNNQGGSFLPNNSIGASTYTPAASFSGSLTLTFTAEAQSPCPTNIATLDLQVNARPNATIITSELSGENPDDGDICEGDNVLLSVEGSGINCVWTNTIGIPNPVPGSCIWDIEELDTSGVFTIGVSVTNMNECDNSNEIEIEIFPDPNLDIIQVSPCEGADFKLEIDADPGVIFENYSWERDGSTLVDENSSSYEVPGVTPGSSGSYTVTAIDNNRCVWSADEIVDIQPISDPQLIDKYTEVCQNAEAYYHVEIISQSSNFIWEIEPGVEGVHWDTTYNDALLIVHWLLPGDYKISVTEFLGSDPFTPCLAETFMDVTVTEGIAPDVPLINYYDLNNLLIAKDPDVTCYQWGYYDPDNREMVEIPGEIYQAYAANDDDDLLDYNPAFDYWVEVWNDPTGNCDSPSCSTVSFRVEQGEGITPEEEEEEVFLIYPNPNNGQFTVKTNQMPKSSYQMKVVDLLGREVLQKEVFSNDGEINELVSFNQPLSVGVYILYIYDELDVYRRGKLVIVQ